MAREVKDLKEQLVISKQEMRTLGRRPQPVEPHEAAEIQDVVINKVLARRKTSEGTEQPVTMIEKRAYEKDTIMSIVRDQEDLLVKWEDIMEACLRGATPQQLRQLNSVSDFIDGFAIRAPNGMTGGDLRRILKNKGMDVKPPIERKGPGDFWLQLANGPYDLAHNSPLLRAVVD